MNNREFWIKSTISIKIGSEYKIEDLNFVKVSSLATWVCSTLNYFDWQSGSFLPDIDSFLRAKLNCSDFPVLKTYFTKKAITMFKHASLLIICDQKSFAMKIWNKKWLFRNIKNQVWLNFLSRNVSFFQCVFMKFLFEIFQRKLIQTCVKLSQLHFDTLNMHTAYCGVILFWFYGVAHFYPRLIFTRKSLTLNLKPFNFLYPKYHGKWKYHIFFRLLFIEKCIFVVFCCSYKFNFALCIV